VVPTIWRLATLLIERAELALPATSTMAAIWPVEDDLARNRKGRQAMIDVAGSIWVFVLLAPIIALIVAVSTIRIAKEYERGVVFRLGRLITLKGPGLFFIVPFGIDHVRKVDLRVVALEVPQQEVITSDNVTVKVNAVIFFQVIDAQAAIVRVYNFMEATSQIAQTTLRAVLGQSSLDELLGARDKINDKLKTIIDRQTEPWGIKVGTVELKDAQLAESMVRALARQAEAEREKRAKVIATEGEFQAAQVLANAAQIISTQPAALALRYMQTLLDMGANQNSTIVFPVPIELIRPLLAAPVPMSNAVAATGTLPTKATELVAR
jgi:regulator of protease activity HflC (stomatin/prohibitin superfamily)